MEGPLCCQGGEAVKVREFLGHFSPNLVAVTNEPVVFALEHSTLSSADLSPPWGRRGATMSDSFREPGRTFHVSDYVISGMGSLACLYLCTRGRWAPGAPAAAVVFAVIALGPIFLRGLAYALPAWPQLHLAASLWLLPAVIFGHCNLGPLSDAANPRLYDRLLMTLDDRIFGAAPSVVLDRLVGPAFTELFMVCYYSYFLWPTALGLTLYFVGKREAFEELTLALALFYAANFVLYIAVPAIGPRFFMASAFPEPLRGLWLTPYLDSLMRNAPFTRDCFPSGHTGATLVVLLFAFRHHRPFFFGLLPIATGLIAGTLVGRFHYAIDLVAALPLVALASLSAQLSLRPGPRLLPLGRKLVREPVKA